MAMTRSWGRARRAPCRRVRRPAACDRCRVLLLSTALVVALLATSAALWTVGPAAGRDLAGLLGIGHHDGRALREPRKAGGDDLLAGREPGRDHGLEVVL